MDKAVDNQQLSDRINNLSESQTLAMAGKARALAAQGIEVIKMSLGEPDFPTPKHIRKAAKRAIKEGYTFYSPVSGYQDLREAIAAKFRRDNNLPYQAENVVVSTGAKQSIANLFLCLLNPGDEVIVFTPYWVSYIEVIKLAEGIPVPVIGSLENDYKVTPKDLEAAITDKTRAMIFSSPCNPTGTVFTKDDMEGYAEVLRRHPNVFVISDEIYEYITFDAEPFSIGSLDGMFERTATVNGFSKGFAMTGWRVGYVGAPKWLAQACDKMQGQITSGTCSIAQRAALEAITADLEPTREMTKAYRRRRDLVRDMMQEIPGMKCTVPEGAFYLFPDVSYYFGKTDGKETVNDAEDLAMYLLSNAQVATVTGAAFGAPNCLRLSYAASDEELMEAMRRMRGCLGHLK